MKISSEQIQNLYKFTQKHYVEYFDLQTELVDHLANGIETQWQHNPHISFEDALEKEFKKFGVFGFMEVVEERQKALGKKYLGIIKKEFLSYFSWPEFIKFATLWSVLFAGLYWVGNKEMLVVSLLIIIFVVMLYMLFKLNHTIKQRRRNSNKKWMLEQHIFNLGGVVRGMFIPLELGAQLRLFELFSWSVLTITFVSLAITIYVFLLYIMIYKIPKKARVYLTETYPEYNYS
ncbi:hypothetical protein JoomaDRAFT_1359 [Galbibacter orientalis DSM 19592]|uniref:Uncharacterized protein n=1 Tax=Galbibacter orientalis DSM 19592 TaxID=926559 RepID=I3C431_9FLAO|nr:hypothetical protein [Galbibacter orientalis]EIJ38374.1 hypothetical protein JoomaDRAFT_1359 [Galbibacter orientalis DSM 19592]